MTINASAILVVVCLLFAAIHFFEVLAYVARLAGYHAGRAASAYALYNTVFIITRLFTMAMLPALGLVVDSGMPSRDYYLGCIFAMLLAASASIFVISNADRYVARFSNLLSQEIKGFRLLKMILSSVLLMANSAITRTSSVTIRESSRDRMFWVSAITHFIYSSSVFFMFSLALLIPDYRASLSHLSGLTNAFGALLLTFWIEPRISYAVDSGITGGKDGVILLKMVLLGRLFGIGFVSTLFFATLFLVQI